MCFSVPKWNCSVGTFWLFHIHCYLDIRKVVTGVLIHTLSKFKILSIDVKVSDQSNKNKILPIFSCMGIFHIFIMELRADTQDLILDHWGL